MDSNNEQLFYMRLGVNSFLEKYRELLSAFDLQQVAEALAAYSNLGNGVLPEKHGIPVYRIFTETAFLTLYDRGALSPIAPFTALGESDLAKMRRSSGVGAELLPPPPPTLPTAEELLRHEIAADWRTLPMDKVRAKKNGNRQYASMLEKMANEGSLDSVATSLQRAGG